MNEVHNIKMLRRICGKEGPTKWEDTLSLSLYCGLSGGSSSGKVVASAMVTYGLSVIVLFTTLNDAPFFTLNGGVFA